MATIPIQTSFMSVRFLIFIRHHHIALFAAKQGVDTKKARSFAPIED